MDVILYFTGGAMIVYFLGYLNGKAEGEELGRHEGERRGFLQGIQAERRAEGND